MNKDKLYSIGEISKITNTNITALRYYDKVNLLKPEIINEETGYRYYSANQITIINKIRYYRKLGFSLDEIRLLLTNNQIEIEQMLIKRQKEISGELHKLEVIKEGIEFLVDATQNKKDDSIKIKYIPKMTIAFDRYCGKATKQEMSLRFSKLMKLVEENNYLIIGEAMMIHHTHFSKYDINNVDIEVAIAIENNDGDNIRTFGGFFVVSAYHYGSYKTMIKTYKKMMEWLEINGYQYSDGAYERYIIDVITSNNEEDFITEINLPINK